MLMMTPTWGAESIKDSKLSQPKQGEADIAVEIMSLSKGEEDVNIHIRHLEEDDEGGDSDSELNPSSGAWYPVGARVLKKFPEQWKLGFIVDYNQETTKYTIRYEDEQEETYPLYSPLLDVIVKNANDYSPYDIGTLVYREIHEEFGTIVNFNNWVYTVTWDKEGNYQRYHELKEVQHIVEAAELALASGIRRSGPPLEEKKKKGRHWKILLVLTLMAGLMLTMYTVKKRRVNAPDKRFRRAEVIAQQYQDRNRNLQSAYRDDDLELAVTTATMT